SQAPLSADAMSILKAYDFPGNIRELRNVLERALIDSGGDVILPEHLRFVKRSEPVKTQAGGVVGTSASGNPSEEEKIVEFARQKRTINNAQCRQLLSVGIHRAWYLLRKLHQQGR